MEERGTRNVLKVQREERDCDSRAPLTSVSVLLEAGEHIDRTIRELRESVKFWKYEFIVIDRGSPKRVWLAQQGDVQLIVVPDRRECLETAHQMARYKARVIRQESGEWAFESRDIQEPPTISPVTKKKLFVPPPDGFRILHISSFPDNTRGITESLKAYGEVECFDWKKNLKNKQEAMNDELFRLSIDYQPSVIFMEECFTGDVLPETIRRIKRLLRVGVVNWCGDIREQIPASMLAMGAVVDWTMLSNRPQVAECIHKGIHAAFLPSGCATNIYKPVPPDREKYPADIIFLGSGGRDYPFSKLRTLIVEGLHKRYGERFAVYGRGWSKKQYPWVQPFIEPAEEEAVAYSSCKVAVGVSAFQVDGYTSARM